MQKYRAELEEYKSLLFDKEIGREARKYLILRGFDLETVKMWEIGFSPLGYIPKCYRNSVLKSKFYEKMNGRVTMPIYQGSNLVSICGRTIYDAKPKYIHYQCPTHQLLFGLSVNYRQIFEDNLCVFVEGQLDVISAWKHGFRNCVCTFGAHFSNVQIINAARYCSRVAIMYDNDEAGRQGASKSFAKLKNKGDMDIRNYGFFLGENQDVDDWVKENDYHRVIDYFNRDDMEVLRHKILMVANT